MPGGADGARRRVGSVRTGVEGLVRGWFGVRDRLGVRGWVRCEGLGLGYGGERLV